MSDVLFLGKLRMVKRKHPPMSFLYGVVWYGGKYEGPEFEVVFEQWDGNEWIKVELFDPDNKAK